MVITREQYNNLTVEDFKDLIAEFNKKHYLKFYTDEKGFVCIRFEDGVIYQSEQTLDTLDPKTFYPTKEMVFMTKEEIKQEVMANRIPDVGLGKYNSVYFRIKNPEELTNESLDEWDRLPEYTVVNLQADGSITY